MANALTPCALFAIGLGLSIDGLRANIGRASLLTAVKLVIMPVIVYGLSVSLGLDPLYTIAAVICAAVPTAKTAYILAGEYRCEEMMVAATVSMTTLACISLARDLALWAIRPGNTHPCQIKALDSQNYFFSPWQGPKTVLLRNQKLAPQRCLTWQPLALHRPSTRASAAHPQNISVRVSRVRPVRPLD